MLVRKHMHEGWTIWVEVDERQHDKAVIKQTLWLMLIPALARALL
jgi:hypothetical protein